MQDSQKKETSVWSDVLATYRDIEIAKRSQPRRVQGADQVQVPYQQNINAPAQPVSITGGAGFIPAGFSPGYLMLVGAGLIGLFLFKKMKS